MYCLAAYIRLFGFSFERKKTLVLLICVYFTTVLLRVLCLYLEEEFTFPYSYSLVFYKDNMFPILLISLLVFLLFKNITIKHSKIINIVASATFGVYLIHENRYIRSVLKKYVFGRFGMDYRYLIPYSIFAIVVLFIICTCFELARMNLIEKKYMKWIRMNKDTISSIIKKLKDSIFHRVNRFHNSG